MPHSTALPANWNKKNVHAPGWLDLVETEALANLSVTAPSTLLHPYKPLEYLPCIDFRPGLLQRSMTPARKDAAWRYIAQRAQAEKTPWSVFALGAAHPGLVKRAGKLSVGKTRAQVDAMEYRLIIEFLDALHDPNIMDKPWILSRIIGRAYDRVSARKTRAAQRADTDDVPADVVDVSVSIEVIGENTLPEHRLAYADGSTALDRLIRQSRTGPAGMRLSSTHRELILRTYFDGQTLGDAATAMDMSLSNASKYRTRAELLIAHMLGRPELLADTPPAEAQIPSPRPGGQGIYSGSGRA